MPQRDGALPPEFWTRPATAAALATCDIATIVEDIRRTRGWSQGELAKAVGYSQSWVSRVVNGQQSLTIDQVRDLAGRLGIPLHLLRFGGAAEPAKGADPTRRREFGKAVTVSALALPLTSAQRRGDTAAADSEIHEQTAVTLRAITGGQRRLDASSPARDLARGAVAHVELAGRTLKRAQGTPFAADVAAAASEAAGFAAWLHADMGDAGSARAFYRASVDRARRAGQRLLDVYMLGSLAAFEIDADDPALGLSLAHEAGRRLSPGAHPTATAWLACVRALGHAGMGAGDEADQEIALAEQAVNRSDNAEPPWPWVFAFDHAKVAGYRALAAVRLHRPHQARAAFAEAFTGTRPGPKQSAILQVELAKAHADAGDGDEALRLAADALAVGVRLQSERVVDRVRGFRRAYRVRGPGADRLDDQLTAALTGGLPAVL
ncbi:helix-turn-helix domain-containing protein [Nocardiopsis composta]|uniref:Transcriptional regulator with XRE-family HTH domain n=1 Tax=Nocardiopsis composta TaxID=157465 RepID=A0A7W8QU06_9ACTN|nr:helix-turn-helix domain-containing protein [Nocardiopsis composta]MBB5435975.1 transcriptional regulator with XRE-family HTH domain [Nocardiopsis composta]